MQVAEVLSDLTSLRACDHESATALVNSHRLTSQPSEIKSTAQKDATPSRQEPVSSSSLAAAEDPDLQRALDLVDLHYNVKEKYKHGIGASLQKSRHDVERVIATLRLS